MDYLKTKKDCKEFCFEDVDGPLSEDCINDLVNYANLDRSKIGTDFCSTEGHKADICKIIDTPQFKSLILFIIIFLRFIYSVRSQNSFKYDEDLVPLVSNVNLTSLGLTLQELSCVKFPGQESFVRKGFPNRLDTYLKVLQQRITPTNNELKKEYGAYLSDFQPWARNLSDFVNHYGKDVLETYFYMTQLPKIEKLANYGQFVSKQYIKYFEENRQLENFGKNLIQFIHNETLLTLKSNNGYTVSQASWKMFIDFMTSDKDLKTLDKKELQELCNSLELCGNAGEKTQIISNLLRNFKNRIPYLETRVVPNDLMTVYCANPKLVCVNQIPNA